MEQNSKTNLLLYFIIVLLILNLIISIMTAFKPTDSKTVNIKESMPLPASLSKYERDVIIYNFKTFFNERDLDKIFNMFGDAVRIQLDKNKFSEEFNKLINLFDKIEKGAYSHYEYLGEKNGLKAFKLYYNVVFPSTIDLGSNGVFKVTITDNGKEYSIVHFYLGTNT